MLKHYVFKMKTIIQIIKTGIVFRFLFSILLGFVFVLPANSQNLVGSKDPLHDLNQYRSQYIQEKLYVYTDKDSYLSKRDLLVSDILPGCTF